MRCLYRRKALSGGHSNARHRARVCVWNPSTAYLTNRLGALIPSLNKRFVKSSRICALRADHDENRTHDYEKLGRPMVSDSRRFSFASGLIEEQAGP